MPLRLYRSGTQEESNDREEQIFDIDESSVQSTSILRGCIRTMELAAFFSSEDDDEEFNKNVRQTYEEIDEYRPMRCLRTGNPKSISILGYTN